MSNSEQNALRNDTPDNDDYNSITAVEQVYPAEIIDTVMSVNNLSDLSPDVPFDPQHPAANDAFAYADIYSLSGARMAKHNRCLERRANKSQLTDRRSSVRLSADGEIQEDRRAGNRAANIQSIRLSSDNKSDVA